MHELGLVFHVIENVETIAKEQQLTEIGSVTLEVGKVSAIIPEYLTDCWKWARLKTELLKTTELIIEEIPAVTYCEDCGGTYDTTEYKKQCPHCGSLNTYLKTGNEFTIKEIEAC